MVVPKSSHDRSCSKESSQNVPSTITISESVHFGSWFHESARILFHGPSCFSPSEYFRSIYIFVFPPCMHLETQSDVGPEGTFKKNHFLHISNLCGEVVDILTGELSIFAGRPHSWQRRRAPLQAPMQVGDRQEVPPQAPIQVRRWLSVRKIANHRVLAPLSTTSADSENSDG